MKKVTKILICVFAVSMFLNSCSFEKRLYTKGYHIDWMSKKDIASPEQQNDFVKNESFDTAMIHPQEQISDAKDMAFFPFGDLNATTVLNEKTEITLASSESIPSVTSAPESRLAKTSMSISSETKITSTEVLPKNKKLTKRLFSKSSDGQILLIILALLLPPLAMYMYEGNNWTSRCALNLFLTLFCFFFPGVIHALIVILVNK
ncbi:MAG: YqaE/Pmp3 family membrane protein [Bacteroidota bacterium]